MTFFAEFVFIFYPFFFVHKSPLNHNLSVKEFILTYIGLEKVSNNYRRASYILMHL